MEKEKITLPIGSNKALVFEADPANKEEQDFAKLCKEVSATQPQSLQDFFTRLNDLQQKKTPEPIKKMGRKM
ncbi:hypothetical protein [Asinibacterium sp. OR53]|uniref:hypothetical protein n=1 Tax=Asinibacterium sp. OR53 TaxID=925409 RepID=UPI00047A4B5F|nr:hypothetical protein [Asinibacterium sp. OR53]